jgi:hypothetical protein
MPPPPPAPILTAEPIPVAQPVAAFIEPPEEPTEIPFWRRRLELSPAPTGANEVVIVGVRLPLGDMMNLIITFWVASILISVVLGFIAFAFVTVVGRMLR